MSFIYDIVAAGGQVQLRAQTAFATSGITDHLNPAQARQVGKELLLAADRADLFDRRSSLRARQRELQQEITNIQRELATLEDQP